MTDPVDLNVQVLNSEIVVNRPETGDQVTFRKDGPAPVLMSLDSMRIDPDRARVSGPCLEGCPCEGLSTGLAEVLIRGSGSVFRTP